MHAKKGIKGGFQTNDNFWFDPTEDGGSNENMSEWLTGCINEGGSVKISLGLMQAIAASEWDWLH